MFLNKLVASRTQRTEKAREKTQSKLCGSVRDKWPVSC
ncbi:hypothetical protein CGRA01v4_01935 [Colletotrichum graminicola]|nr:hypothetical protein CGRA01v4_01935 [Colletotrichum graminicola]